MIKPIYIFIFIIVIIVIIVSSIYILSDNKNETDIIPTQECSQTQYPPPINTGNFIFEESGRLKKKDNTFSYETNNDINFNDFLYQADGTLKKKDNSFIYKNGNIDFDKYLFNNNNKKLSTKDGLFSYDASGKIIKDNIIINPDKTLEFNNFIYNNTTGILNNKTNNFVYNKDGKITKGSININPDNSLDFNNFIYDATGVLRDKNNIFQFSNNTNTLSFDNFVYDENKKLTNSEANFEFANNTIKYRDVLIDPTGKVVKGETTINADNTLLFNNFVYGINGKLINQKSNFEYNNGFIKLNNIFIDPTGKVVKGETIINADNSLDFNKYNFNPTTNVLTSKDGNINIDNTNKITTEDFIYNPDRSLNFNNYNYNSSTKNLNTNDGNLTIDNNNKIITPNFIYTTNGMLAFDKYNYNSTNNNLYKIDGTLSIDNTNKITTEDFIYNPDRTLNFNNYTYNSVNNNLTKPDINLNVDSTNKITTPNFIYNSNNDNKLISGEYIIDPNKNLSRIDNYFSFSDLNNSLNFNVDTNNFEYIKDIMGEVDILKKTDNSLIYQNNILYTPDFNYNQTRDISFNSFNNLTYRQLTGSMQNSIITYDKTGKFKNVENKYLVDISGNIKAYKYFVDSSGILRDNFGNLIKTITYDLSGNTIIETFSNIIGWNFDLSGNRLTKNFTKIYTYDSSGTVITGPESFDEITIYKKINDILGKNLDISGGPMLMRYIMFCDIFGNSVFNRGDPYGNFSLDNSGVPTYSNFGEGVTQMYSASRILGTPSNGYVCSGNYNGDNIFTFKIRKHAPISYMLINTSQIIGDLSGNKILRSGLEGTVVQFKKDGYILKETLISRKNFPKNVECFNDNYDFSIGRYNINSYQLRIYSDLVLVPQVI
jgi:hypothetical protein